MSRIQVIFVPLRNLVELVSQRSTQKSATVEYLEAHWGEDVCACTTLPTISEKKTVWRSGRWVRWSPRQPFSGCDMDDQYHNHTEYGSTLTYRSLLADLCL
jgi:hypothetical protein